jgi:hypothetical protein
MTILYTELNKRITTFQFHLVTDRLSGPPNLLSNGYRGLLSMGLKRQGCEDHHSPPASAEVKKNLNYTSTPPYVFKHKDNFTFT